MRRQGLLLVALLLVLAPAGAQGREGAVAANHPLSASAGRAMLEQGGTAFDAVVAMTLVSGVVAPHSSGLGGGGFAVFRDAGGPVRSLDFRERAPAAFGADTFAEPGRDSRRGPWSVAIPGELAGLWALHSVGGGLPWADVVEPARALAAGGFSVGPDLAGVLERRKAAVLADPGLRADFAPRGVVLSEGERCVRPALARTLEYVQAHGGASLYRGPLARGLVGTMVLAGAPWTAEDLASYEPVERAPIRAAVGDRVVWSMGPPSSGGVAIAQAIGLRERLLAAGQPADQALVQALVHAFADRATYGGDPDFVEVPLDELLAASTFDALAQGTPTDAPVPTAEAGLAALQARSSAPPTDDHGTAHLSAIDADGRAVALTSTINWDLGALLADPNTGVVLNDEIDDFTTRIGEPNAFGLVQGERNAVRGGKRPLSSMSPTLVTDAAGEPLLALGGAGGPRIISATLQVLLAALNGAPVSEAVARPRLHHQWLPAVLFVEPGLVPERRSALETLGFVVQDKAPLGVVQAVARDGASGAFTAAGDPRRNTGAAVVVPPQETP